MADDMRGVVGYALLPKKQQSFIQDSLLSLCKSRGIDLVRIDQDRRLIDQGPFDCVLHKMYGDDWRKQLEEFQIQNPNSTIIDSPVSIQRLHNRISMLQAVSELKIESGTDTFGIPKQIVIYDKESLFDRQSWEFLKYPVIAKPLIADGSAKSHKMALVFNHEGLNKLKPPIVLQEFVNHGGVIFKVYVVGEFVKCVKRKSLPDVSEEKLKGLEGSLPFSQVSNLTSDERNDDKYYKLMDLEETELPPQSFITDIARGLRRGLKLNLFNFDVIRDARIGNRYLVIDINYFPGYAKMPGYETVLTDFFCDVVGKKSLSEEKEKGGVENLQVVRNCDVDLTKIVSKTCCSDGEDWREREITRSSSLKCGKQKTKVGDNGGCGSMGSLSGGWGIGLGRREEQRRYSGGINRFVASLLVVLASWQHLHGVLELNMYILSTTALVLGNFQILFFKFLGKFKLYFEAFQVFPL